MQEKEWESQIISGCCKVVRPDLRKERGQGEKEIFLAWKSSRNLVEAFDPEAISGQEFKAAIKVLNYLLILDIQIQGVVIAGGGFFGLAHQLRRKEPQFGGEKVILRQILQHQIGYGQGGQAVALP
jgi:hypothetical protein